MNLEHDIITTFTKTTPRMSDVEKVRLWTGIQKSFSVTSKSKHPSPYMSFLVRSKKYALASMALLLIVATGGGTAYASDTARPGDQLFFVDRAIEDTRLFIARSEHKKTLSERFAQERLLELRSILDEETILTTPMLDEPSFTSLMLSTSTLLAIEADVFTDRTTLKVEYADQKYYLETSERTREGIVRYLARMLPRVSSVVIEEVLVLEVEDRESRPKERGFTSLKDEVRVGSALAAVTEFLEQSPVSLEERTVIVTQIHGEMESRRTQLRPQRIERTSEGVREELRIEPEGRVRYEVRDKDMRMRIEYKDGEVEVKTHSKDFDEDEYEDREDSFSDLFRSDDSTGRDGSHASGGDSGRHEDSSQEEKDEDDDRDDDDNKRDEDRSGKGSGDDDHDDDD